MQLIFQVAAAGLGAAGLKLKEAVTTLETDGEGTAVLHFSPFDPLLTCVDYLGVCRTYSTQRIEAGAKPVNRFHAADASSASASEALDSHSSSGDVAHIFQLNELHGAGLLGVCSLDGTVRIWRNHDMRGQQSMATAFQAVQRPPVLDSGGGGFGADGGWWPAAFTHGMGGNLLFASGGSHPMCVNVWDLTRELCVQQVVVSPGPGLLSGLTVSPIQVGPPPFPLRPGAAAFTLVLQPAALVRRNHGIELEALNPPCHPKPRERSSSSARSPLPPASLAPGFWPGSGLSLDAGRRCCRPWLIPQGVAQVLCADREQPLLAVGCSGGAVQLLDLRTKEHLALKIQSHSPDDSQGPPGSDLVGLALRPEGLPGARLVTAAANGMLKLWDIRRTGDPSSPTKAVKAHSPTSGLSVLAWHPHAPLLATATKTHTLKVWTATGENIGAMRAASGGFLGAGKSGAINCLQFHPYNWKLAAGGDNNVVAIYTIGHR